MFCPSCGKQLAEQSKFCRYCGTAIQDLAMSAVQAEQNFVPQPTAAAVTAPETDASAAAPVQPATVVQTPETAPAVLTEPEHSEDTVPPVPNPAPAPASAPAPPAPVKLKFCEYCGTRLDPGMVCNCPGAIEARLEAEKAPPPRNEQLHQIASASKKIASEVGKEAKASLGAMVSNPTDMAAAHSFSRVLSIALITAAILAKTWFIDRLVKAFLYGTFTLISNQRSAPGEAVSHASITAAVGEVQYFETRQLIYIFIIMALQSVFFAALLYFLPKIYKKAGFMATPDTALSTAAYSSVPWTAAALVSSLALTVFTFNSLSVYLMFALSGAALFISFSLMDTGIRKYIPNDKQRLVILAAGYGVQLMAVIFAVCSFVPERIMAALLEAVGF